MSRNYKFDNPDGLYFISFAVVGCLDVFVRNKYKNLFVESLAYCQQEKGLEIHAWCIMTSHVHLVFRASGINVIPKKKQLNQKFPEFTRLGSLRRNLKIANL